MIRTFTILIFTATLAIAGSSVHTLYDSNPVTVHTVNSTKAKDGIIDLANIAADASKIYEYERVDFKTEIKLQKHLDLVLMEENFELKREADLQSNRIDLEYNDQEVNLLQK